MRRTRRTPIYSLYNPPSPYMGATIQAAITVATPIKRRRWHRILRLVIALPLIGGLLLAGSFAVYQLTRPLNVQLPNAFDYQQQHPLSCEAAAAHVASAMLGVGLTEDDILAALPRDPDPNKGFRGDVDAPFGGTDNYGVYAAPIAAAVNTLGGGQGLRAVVIYGEQALRQALSVGEPVVVWITANLRSSERIQQADYYLVPGEHAVTVIGMVDGDVLVSDVGAGYWQRWSMDDFSRSWALFDEQGVAFSRD